MADSCQFDNTECRIKVVFLSGFAKMAKKKMTLFCVFLGPGIIRGMECHFLF